MAGFLDKIQSAVFHVAEGIGKTFEKGAALPGRGVATARSGFGAAVQGLKGASIAAGQRAQAGIFNIAEAFGKPRQTLGAAARGLRGMASGAQSRLHAAGFVTPFSKQYFQQIGSVLKQAPRTFGPMIGRGARGAMGGIGSALLGMGMMGGGAAAGMSSSAASGLSKTMGKLGSATGPVALAAMHFKALIAPAALLGAVALLRKFTFGLSESNRDLAKWNGALAASFAKLDIAQMQMDIRQASATGGSAAALNDALADVIREFQPIREDLGILVNLVGISAATGVKSLISMAKQMMIAIPQLKEIVDGLHIIEDEMKKKNKADGFLGNAALSNMAGMGGGGPKGLDPVADGNAGRAKDAFIARPMDKKAFNKRVGL